MKKEFKKGEVVFANPETKLIVISSGKKTTAEEDTERIAQFLSILIEINQEGVGNGETKLATCLE